MVTLAHWHTEPLLLISLLAIGWGWAVLAGPMRERLAPGQAFPMKEAWYFYLGLGISYLAVGSPLDAVGERFLFSAHMLQHNILMYITPLLILRGLPGWMLDGLFWRVPTVESIWRRLTHPVAAGVVFTGIFSGWHYPELYEMALVRKPIHILEHMTMFAVSFLMWWPIATRSRRLPSISYGSQILFVFALAVGQLPVFAWLTFSGSVHYPTYAFAPRIIPLSPLEDQILGGVLMKTAQMFSGLAVMGVAFIRWYRETEEADARLAEEPTSEVYLES